METYIFSAGLGYLLGLGIHGYVVLLYAIKAFGKRRNLSVLGMNCLIALHYIAGLAAMLFVPSIYFKNYEGEESTIIGILFAIPALSMLVVSLIIARYWEQSTGRRR